MTPRHPDTCNAHSGLVTWMKINTLALTAASSLFSYSVFFQAPELKLQMAEEVHQRKEADRDCSERISDLERWRRSATRVARWEGRK